MKRSEQPITFRHSYHKLAKPEFTTIRGKSQIKWRKVGDKVTVVDPSGQFHAEVVALELKRVRDMDPELLRADASYPGCDITTREQFVKLINSFRPPMWGHVNLDSEMTIITLRKC